MENATETNTGSLRVLQSEKSPWNRWNLDLEPLRAFGAAADVPDGPNINMKEGGFIIPGHVPVPTSNPGKKDTYFHATQQVGGLKEARRGSGLRKRAHGRSETSGSTEETHRAAGKAGATGETHPTTGEASPTARETRPTTIATGASTHTLGRRLSVLLRLEELEHWYPSSRIVRRSSSLALMSVDVGVIRSLPYRGRLLLEIPLDNPRGLIPFPGPTTPAFVPIVRVWARWRDGVRPVGDHVYPDASVCAYMPGEWIWGRDPLHVLLDWYTSWLAKSLHLQFLNRWPGPQHCSARVAMRRKMLDEYCRCGGPKQYGECHYPEDSQRSSYDLSCEEWTGASGYLWEVRRRGWAMTPPWVR